MCQIIREVDGCRALNIIKKGTETSGQKCVSWEKLKSYSTKPTGKSCDRKQFRELFDRIKDKKKC